jgi:hypothetical protein
MQRFGIFLASALLVSGLLHASTASSDVYRYVDDQGHKHAVSDLSMVPEQYRDAARDDAAQRSGGSFNQVESSSSAQSTPTPAAPRAGTGTTQASSGSDAIGGHDQHWWRSQAQAKRNTIDDLKVQLEAARAEEKDTSEVYRRPGNGPGKAAPGRGHGRRAAVASAAYDDDDEEPSVADLEQGVQNAERDLQQFEDQARQAGVPPGWLR